VPFLSPLRYPGGKRRLAGFIKHIFEVNNLLDGDYVEPYVGGGSIALSLLYDEYAQNIWINDLDRSIYAFWYSVLNKTEHLCRLISETQVNMEEWHRQKKIQEVKDVSLLDLGFSTFFLNRTNRSGIISGGVIGGKEQKGKWKLDERYNKENLIRRIEKIERYRDRIRLYNQDANCFLQSILPHLPERVLLYLDPPYFATGEQMLYTNYYRVEDHQLLAQFIGNLDLRWIVSYDNVAEIQALYENFRAIDYSLSYSTQERYEGAEIMFFSDQLVVDNVGDPSKVSKNRLIP
jgi:DNA adenine methylase